MTARTALAEVDHMKAVPRDDLDKKAELDDKRASKRQSVLQIKLNKLARHIGVFGMISAAICIVILFLRFSIKVPQNMLLQLSHNSW
jgi:hypothetical protein